MALRLDINGTERWQTMPLDELKGRLKQQCRDIALRLLGKPSSKSRIEWRWGKRGSLSLAVSGRKQGLWTDHETGDGGSLIDLVMRREGKTFPEAVRWLEGCLNLSHVPPPVAPPVALELPDEDDQRLIEAKALWQAGVNIAETSAETYLRNRSIHAETWPSSLRWHAGKRLLLAAFTAPDGTPAGGIQRIFLMPDGSPVLRNDGSKLKVALGPELHGAVRFPGPADGPLMLCEGVETAASVWVSTGFETWAACGNATKPSLAHVPVSRLVVLCPDDDARNAQSLVHTKKAQERWRGEGRNVVIATPWLEHRYDKSDFNDALRELGPDHVRERILSAMYPDGPPPPEALDIEAARHELARITREAFDHLAGHPEAQLGARVDVGTGKTRAYIEEAVRWHREGRAIIDGKPAPVVIAVPTHKLGGELRDRVVIEAHRQGLPNIRIETWRGREAEDPDVPGAKMCRHLEAVHAAIKALADPQETVCKRGKVECPHYAACAYQEQREKRADIWIVPHALAFQQMPAAIGQPSLVIIDETIWQEAVEGKITSIGMADLEQTPRVYRFNRIGDCIEDNAATADLVAELEPTRKKLLGALNEHPEGYLTRAALQAVGLTAENCRAAVKAEWRRKVDAKDLTPGMPLAAFKERAAKLASRNANIARTARLWSELAVFLDGEGEACGRVSLETREDVSGAQHRVIALRWKEDIHATWSAPVWHVDATMRPDLVRHVLPRFELRGDIAVKAPHQRIIAVVGKSRSHRSFEKPGAAVKLRRELLHAAALEPGETVAILPKAIRAEIEGLGVLPAHLVLEHHGNIAGIDRHRDVGKNIVVGRLLPSPHAVELMAAALSGEAVPPMSRWYAERSVVISDRYGRKASFKQPIHDHPLAEQIRAAICEDGLNQAIGRARGVNRTANTPVVVELWGSDVPPPLPVDEIRQHRDLTVDEEMTALGCWLESAGDAARFWPELGSEHAIKLRRARTVSNSYTKPNTKTIPSSANNSAEEGRLPSHMVRLLYQRQAAGAKRKLAFVDTRIFPEPVGALRERLGPLAIVGTDPPDDDPVRAAVPEEAVEAPLMSDVSFGPPDGPEAILARPQPFPPLVDAYSGGILPPNIRAQAHDMMRRTCLTQDDLARRIGISRPQLTNSLRGRFGLGADAATRLLELLQSPPPTRQLQLMLS